MDVDQFLKSALALYHSAPSFVIWSAPILVGGYIGFLWSGYGFGRWVHNAELAGLKASNEALKAQSEATRTSNEVLKDKASVLEERVKLAQEQAADAKSKAEEFKAEADELKDKFSSEFASVGLQDAISHLDMKASNIVSANNAVSATLGGEKIVWFGGGHQVTLSKNDQK
ncbi:hypothetical protein [Bradyrhizobium sp. SYSU BS000235]|uniref:hypothetical protein n=1 Tax=Bradyrhizobium sp. SYSU BS000235 TaxID=3411332 RepID=UPI003C76D561